MMKERILKYGLNPNQIPARLYMEDKSELPFKVLSGNPGYINFLDAVNGWQLVRELRRLTGLPSAASFKHVSPSGVAVSVPLNDTEKKVFSVDNNELSPIAVSYVRARGTDRMSSFGDFISLSDICDESAALVIKREVSDGIVAPGYTEKALEILKGKKKGNYPVIEMDPDYEPGRTETRRVFGITFEQRINDIAVDEKMIDRIVTENKVIDDGAKTDLLISLVTLKYTQSNSVCYVRNGQTVSVGAGQQSRIHCTRLAGDKADIFHLKSHPMTLNLPFLNGIRRTEKDNLTDLFVSGNFSDVLKDGVWERYFEYKPDPLTEDIRKEFLSGIRGVSLGSDGFFPFRDNIDRAYRSGVDYIVQPGGSVRDMEVIEACNEYSMVMAFAGTRFFHH